LESILNVEISDQMWVQASLPVSMGGLGIRGTQDLAIPAYLASIASTSDLVSQISAAFPNTPNPAREEALSSWFEISGEEVVPLSNLQRAWEAPILEKISTSLIANASSLTSEARIRASLRKESGAWLNALPCAPLGTFMDNDTLRISAALRLGAKTCHPHSCQHCGKPVDELGTHGLSCQKKAGTYMRHSEINKIIKEACSSANVPASLEPSGTFRDDGKRPDGLTLGPWSKGKCLLWDATCADTLANSYVSSTSRSAGAAALQAEKKKFRKYQGALSRYLFVPFAVETLGPFGEEALALVKDLGRRISDNTGEIRSKSFLTQRISIAIQRGNAASIFSTIPTSSKLNEIYYL
jgi:hypothetical protein